MQRNACKKGCIIDTKHASAKLHVRNNYHSCEILVPKRNQTLDKRHKNGSVEGHELVTP